MHNLLKLPKESANVQKREKWPLKVKRPINWLYLDPVIIKNVEIVAQPLQIAIYMFVRPVTKIVDFVRNLAISKGNAAAKPDKLIQLRHSLLV